MQKDIDADKATIETRDSGVKKNDQQDGEPAQSFDVWPKAAARVRTTCHLSENYNPCFRVRTVKRE